MQHVLCIDQMSELEKLLGDEIVSEKYQDLALKLKTTFNKTLPTAVSGTLIKIGMFTA